MSEKLAEKSCIPCAGGVPSLVDEEQDRLVKEIEEDWKIVDRHHLERQFWFDDFAGPLELLNRIGRLSEEEGHHPEMTLTWGRLDVRIWTHKIDGLTESDFVLAAKIDQL